MAIFSGRRYGTQPPKPATGLAVGKPAQGVATQVNDDRRAQLERAKAEAKAKSRARALSEEAGDGDKELDELAQMRLDHKKERERREYDLKAGKAQALQQADARAGLSGAGLSGAAASTRANIGRAQDRESSRELTELGRSQRDEEWQGTQRDIALRQLEEEEDRDLDGDGTVDGDPAQGLIGDGNPENNPVDETTRALTGKAYQNATRGRKTNDEDHFSDDPPGDAKNPYGSTAGERADLEAQGLVFTSTGETGPFGLPLYTDQNGAFWYFDGDKGWW
jgi:hypothetical protein